MHGLDPSTDTWVQNPENDPRERAGAAALPPRGRRQSGPIESGRILRRFPSRQSGDEVLQHWFQPHVRLPT